MSVIRWEEPAGAGGQKERATKWRLIAAELQSRPGEWALVETKENTQKAAQTAHCINTGKLASMPRGHFEAKSRKLGPGQCAVYARYVGPSTEDGTQ